MNGLEHDVLAQRALNAIKEGKRSAASVAHAIGTASAFDATMKRLKRRGLVEYRRKAQGGPGWFLKGAVGG